ncbi:hypothetical protein ACH4E7_12740 [Kitasatospora sp. NPDC018058]|uniref:hypothetical protein n=1 Tax=Kitasatospora sp. NPDC018058 TaxID=3364025 RepID=UPI0037C1A49A
MSEPMEGAEPQKSVGRTRTGLGRAGRWVRGRSKRWVVVGAAAVVLGGAVAAVAVHHEHESHGDGRKWAAGEHERYDGQDQHGGQDERGGQDQRSGQDERGGQDQRSGQDQRGGRHGHQGREDRTGGDSRTEAGAPAPLPATDAAAAVAKASAAVSGGKVESLTPVGEQGGGRAWRAVVLGPDGVRHAVTLDGANGTITGNTVLGG